MCKLLGVVLACDAALSVLQCKVHAKRRAWGETITRDEHPARSWLVIVICVMLAAALVFVF